MGALITAVRRFSQLLVDAVELTASTLLAGLVVVVFVGIVDRYVLRTGQAWPEELSRYLLLWISFLAAAAAAYRLSHYTVNYFADLLIKGKARRYLGAIVSFASAGLFAYLVPKAVALIDVGDRMSSPAMGIPMSLVFGSALAGVGGMAFFFFAAGLEMLGGLRQPGDHVSGEGGG